MLKGWTVTLVIATLLLKGNKYQILIAFIPLLVFWFLDAFFLRHEKMYRELYKWVVKNRLTTDEYLFDMNDSRFENAVPSIFRVMTSITLRWFYGSIAILTVAYLIVIFIVQKGGC
jgi:hypothetical protein